MPMPVKNYKAHSCNGPEFFSIITSLNKGKVIIKECETEKDTFVPTAEERSPHFWGRAYHSVKHVGDKKRKSKNVSAFLECFLDENKRKIVPWKKKSSAEEISQLYFEEKKTLAALSLRFKHYPDLSEKLKRASNNLDNAYKTALKEKYSKEENFPEKLEATSKKYEKDLKKKAKDFHEANKASLEALAEEKIKLEELEIKYQEEVANQKANIEEIKAGHPIKELNEIEVELAPGKEKLGKKFYALEDKKIVLERLVTWKDKLCKGERKLIKAKKRLKDFRKEIAELHARKLELKTKITEEKVHRGELQENSNPFYMRVGDIKATPEFHEQYKNDKTKDIVIHCRDEEKIYAHKVFIQDVQWIKARFDQKKERSFLFTQEECEDGITRIVLDLKHFSKDAVDCFLKHSYRLPQDSAQFSENAGELVEMAEQFELPHLRVKAENALNERWAKGLKEVTSEEEKEALFDEMIYWLDPVYEKGKIAPKYYLLNHTDGVSRFLKSEFFKDLTAEEKFEYYCDIARRELIEVTKENKKEIHDALFNELDTSDSKRREYVFFILLRNAGVVQLYNDPRILSLDEDHIWEFILEIPVLYEKLYPGKKPKDYAEDKEMQERMETFFLSWALEKSRIDENFYQESAYEKLLKSNFFPFCQSPSTAPICKVLGDQLHSKMPKKLKSKKFAKDGLEDLLAFKMRNKEEALRWISNKTIPLLYRNAKATLPIQQYQKYTSLLKKAKYKRVFCLSGLPSEERELKDKDRKRADRLQEAIYPKAYKQAYATVATHFEAIQESENFAKISFEDLKQIMEDENFPDYKAADRLKILLSWSSKRGEQEVEKAKAFLSSKESRSIISFDEITKEEYSELSLRYPDFLDNSHEELQKSKIRSKGKEKEKK